MRVLRQFGVILGASLLMAGVGAPAAMAGVTCAHFHAWCPEAVSINHQYKGGDQSTPEPGTLGLLALGAAVGVARMRGRKKKS